MNWKPCAEELEESRYSGLVPHTAVTDEGIIFAAAVPEHEKAVLLLRHRKGKGKEYEIPFPEKPYSGRIFAMKVTGVPAGEAEYCFRIGDKAVTDPYSQVIAGELTYGEERTKPLWSGFAPQVFDWGGDKKPLRIPFRDSIFYELNVRSFTKGRKSRVRRKGTFSGLTEKIPYLKQLGITGVVLMPCYEFDETAAFRRAYVGLPEMHFSENFYQLKADQPQAGTYAPAEDGKKVSGKVPEERRVNLWGFGPGLLLAPKRGYCATDNPYREFCHMVKSFHEEGIEVLMEMDLSWGATPALQETALLWWSHTCHVDGFFLYGDQGELNTICKSPALCDCKLISDYFPADRMYPKGRESSFRNLAECNFGFRDDARKLLKGDESSLGPFVSRNRYNPADTAVINAMTGHDGFTMADLVSYNEAHNDENGTDKGGRFQFSWNCGSEGASRRKEIRMLRRKQIRNAFAMMLLSEGTPMLLAGDELGNSQNGNSNAWCIDNETSWVDWSSSSSSTEILEFVKKLIAFRKAHPIIHPEKELQTDGRGGLYPQFSCHGKNAWFASYGQQDRSIGMMYCGEGGKDTAFAKTDGSDKASSDTYLYIAWNFHWEEKELALPILPKGREWKVVLSTADTGAEVSKSVLVPGRTVLALEG